MTYFGVELGHHGPVGLAFDNVDVLAGPIELAPKGDVLGHKYGPKVEAPVSSD